MDCSGSWGDCKYEIEGREKKEDDESWGDDLTFGILGTDYDNWYVLYVCGQWPESGGMMQTLTIMGKQEQISEEKLEEAKAVIAAKVPEFDLSPLLMKDGGQGTYWLGLGSCEYEWDLDQIEFDD